MNKNLILVESPSKAKTINKYLGKDFIVEATVGHLKNLPKTKLGVDIENGFRPSLLNIRGKGDIIKKIKELASKSNTVFIATDPDREGEAIAQDIADLINGKTNAKIKRVLFNEITKHSVKAAIENPKEININLVNSQRARRVMDRIIGYKISPFLWKAVVDSGSLSAGRVQSVALRLVCEREEEIEKFVPTEYWNLIAQFMTEDGKEFSAKLYEMEGKQLKVQPKPEMTEEDWKEFLKNNFAINTESLAKEIATKIESKNKFVISDITKKENKRNPFPPFITSTLQVEASRKLGFRPKKTMMLAQNLYEGIELGKEGPTGLITYMRTDSTRLSEEIIYEARSFIEHNFGKNHLPARPRNYEQKNKKHVQDAHEAIRPTSLKYTPEYVKPFLSNDQYKLYELIWKRFIACQMESAVLEVTTVFIKADEFIFRASGTAIQFPGFLAIYDESSEDSNGNNANENGQLPIGLYRNQELQLKELKKIQSFTKPPARYTESSLIKELESKGIGRPSTYALIMSTIIERNYVEQIDKKLIPTKLGKKVNKILVENFPNIIDVDFTAKMEDELDTIADGNMEYERVLRDFYEPFSKTLQEVESKIEKPKCEICGADMEIKIGRYGKFLACTNYPKCKNIKSLKELSENNSEPEFTGEKCPKCGARTVFREGKYGRFIGCERYPECDFTKVITTGIQCPKCKEGELTVKKTKRGKIFYGCNRYPECDYATWKLPKEEVADENNV
ncbi:type I DNA topoisomerase [Melioribacteraceae bacterium 4301-Me]|uniref:type I DNA topoisomerase n=1 Tax=Pyranulibacter aquaticus TaxID=3163344 RepID=UPI003594FBB6